MKIDDFIKWLNKQQLFIRRGVIIDKLSHLSDNWVIAIKSLLIKNIQATISRSYLVQKLGFAKNHPDKPYLFLDVYGIIIYIAIKDYNQL